MYQGNLVSSSNRAKSAALVCCHFARNLAYYNASQGFLTLDKEGFWLTVIGNFVDVCVLEWCKLFGNRNGKCHWENVLKQPNVFKQDLLNRHHLEESELRKLWKTIKDYRDNFIAHVEDQETTPIPCMTVPYLLVNLYFARLQSEFSELQSFDCLPKCMDGYFDSSLSEAKEVFRLNKNKVDGNTRTMHNMALFGRDAPKAARP